MATETQNTHGTTVINDRDAIFCTHFKEVCTDCNFDGREENDSFFGFEFIDCEDIECPPATQNKDAVCLCKKHGSNGCNQCFRWKKQITEAHSQAKKAGRK